MNAHPDLHEDLTDRIALARSCEGRARAFLEHLGQRPDWYAAAERERMARRAGELASECAALAESLAAALARDPADAPAELSTLKRDATRLLRLFQSDLGALLTAGDWQSPSFDHALLPESGKRADRIVGTEIDYKRDWHHDASAYESAFRAEYIDAPLRVAPRIYLTASGMASFSTAVCHLRMRGRLDGPLLVGNGCYFQNRILLDTLFGDQVTYVDELDADAVVAAARRLSPSAVFLDSLCNTETLAIPDLARLLPALSRALPLRSAIVLDNSGLATGFQPFAHLPRTPHPALYVVESLNKHHQFGLDRVTAGILWTSGVDQLSLTQARMHLGTNAADASACALPAPNRDLLNRRLARIDRNAVDLATRLAAHAAARPRGPLERVVHPGLPDYPGYAWTKDLPFRGASIVLLFSKKYVSPAFYKRFLSDAVASARAHGANLTAGTSFGLDVSRVYLTAVHADRHARAFMRLSAGTETPEEIQRLAEAIADACDRT